MTPIRIATALVYLVNALVVYLDLFIWRTL